MDKETTGEGFVSNPTSDLEEKRLEFQRTKENILSQLPSWYTDLFGEVGLGKFSGKHFPVMILSPFDVPKGKPSKVRDTWLAAFENMKKGDRLTQDIGNICIVYWYGADETHCFGYIRHKEFTPLVEGKWDDLETQALSKEKKKQKGQKRLTNREDEFIRGMQLMKADADLPKQNRNRQKILFFEFKEEELLEKKASVTKQSVKQNKKVSMRLDTAKDSILSRLRLSKRTRSDLSASSVTLEVEDSVIRSLPKRRKEEMKPESISPDLDTEDVLHGQRENPINQQTNDLVKNGDLRNTGDDESQVDGGTHDTTICDDEMNECGFIVKLAKKVGIRKLSKKSKKETKSSLKIDEKKVADKSASQDVDPELLSSVHNASNPINQKVDDVDNIDELDDAGDQDSEVVSTRDTDLDTDLDYQESHSDGDVDVSKFLVKSMKKGLNKAVSVQLPKNESKAIKILSKLVKEKKAEDPMKREENEYHRCCKEYSDLVSTLEQAVYAKDFANISVQLVSFANVAESFSAPFLEHQISPIIKKTKLLLKDAKRDDLLKHLKALNSQLNSLYLQKKDTVPLGFKPPKSSPFVPKVPVIKIKSELSNPKTDTDSVRSLSSVAITETVEDNDVTRLYDETTMNVAQKRSSSVSDVKTPVGCKENSIFDDPVASTLSKASIKLERKSAFSLGKLGQMIHRDQICEKEIDTVRLQSSLPRWLVGPCTGDEIPPMEDHRILALDYFRDMATQVPTGKIDADCLVVSLEKALYEWASSSTRSGTEIVNNSKDKGANAVPDKAPWIDVYWNRLHAIVAGFVGKKENTGTLLHLVMSGSYPTPMKLVDLNEEDYARAFLGQPLGS